MLGSEGIKQAINNFEDARKVDLQNERLPPSHDEVRRSTDAARDEAFKRASREAEADSNLAGVARRISMSVDDFFFYIPPDATRYPGGRRPGDAGRRRASTAFS